MIKGIGFENMKVLRDKYWFDFRPITLLTGTNNSGKSSIISAMQMLQENLVRKGLDNLLNTTLKLKVNQNKFGSIQNFVSKASQGQDNTFTFISQIKSIRYEVLVGVKNAIEDFGAISGVKAYDANSNSTIFQLKVSRSNPDYEFSIKINFKYFVKILEEQYANTKALHHEAAIINSLLEEVNNESRQTQDLLDLVSQLSKKFSVYIAVYKQETKWAYRFLETEDEMLDYCDHDKAVSLDEVRALFNGYDENGIKLSGLLSPKKLEDKYSQFIDEGPFDFPKLFADGSSLADFHASICAFYKSGLPGALLSFSNDLLTVLSEIKWTVRFIPEENQWGFHENRIEYFLGALADLGLSATALCYSPNSNAFHNIGLYGIEVHSELNESAQGIRRLRSAYFFEGPYAILSSAIQKHLSTRDYWFAQDAPINRSISADLGNLIKTKLLNIDFSLSNTFVSSQRYPTKRQYNFNDHSDFTNLLQLAVVNGLNDRSESLRFINRWLQAFDIADAMTLKPDAETGNFKAYLKVGDQHTLLADYGLGTNQLLPIIISLSIQQFDDYLPYRRIPRTVVIEEPEANLHPALQSQLADMFVDAISRFRVQIIVETHSEYLIRKLQYLTASKGSPITTRDTVIYYFNRLNPRQNIDSQFKQITKIEIDQNGRLTKEFGSGFFDEADNIAMKLFLLNRDQDN